MRRLQHLTSVAICIGLFACSEAATPVQQAAKQVGGARTDAPGANETQPATSRTASLPTLDKSRLKVQDGDTLYHGSERIRLLGMDAPEAESPYHRGSQQPHADQATALVQRLVDEASVVTIARHADKDKYGRTLAYCFVDGSNISAAVVAAGLAYENVGYYGPQGFDDYAAEVTRAAKTVPTPVFEPPHKFRKRNRKQK
ncbi:MAG: thermonuclease family protein [Planctomycetota bacterium]